jgi:hypothetical protein
MKIILFSVLAIFVLCSQFVAANINNSDKLTNQFDLFCSGVNKNVCTKDLLEFGREFFLRRLKEIENEAIRRRKQQRQNERNRRMRIIKEKILLKILRERFLDRHL